LNAPGLSLCAGALRGGPRAGLLVTAHGSIATPALLVPSPAILGNGLLESELLETGAAAISVSTYDLLPRIEAQRIERLGGLRRLLGWDGPLLLDSPGCDLALLAEAAARSAPSSGSARRQRGQAGRLLGVDEEGLSFRSPIDGSTQRYSPESVLAIQERIGADLAIALDRPSVAAQSADWRATERGERWAARALAARASDGLLVLAAAPLSGDLAQRSASAERLARLPFDGYSVPLPPSASCELTTAHLTAVLSRLPPERLRHVGRLERLDVLLRCIRLGIDFVESAAPITRARAGLLDTAEGTLDLTSLGNVEDPRPPDGLCRCYTCATFSRAYLRHLLSTDELLGYTLTSLHNLTFWQEQVRQVREEISRDA
jgi:queuine tRNA-ribosyltransferase